MSFGTEEHACAVATVEARWVETERENVVTRKFGLVFAGDGSVSSEIDLVSFSLYHKMLTADLLNIGLRTKWEKSLIKEKVGGKERLERYSVQKSKFHVCNNVTKDTHS